MENNRKDSFEFFVSSVEETHEFAEKLIAEIAPGSIVGLSGPLGAGKTELIRGLAQALGVSDQVSSPTFVLETIYDIPEGTKRVEGFGALKHIHHWDLYRTSDEHLSEAIADLRGDLRCLTLVEWPERVASVDDLLDWEILIDFTKLENEENSASSNPTGLAPDGVVTDGGERLITLRRR